MAQRLNSGNPDYERVDVNGLKGWRLRRERSPRNRPFEGMVVLQLERHGLFQVNFDVHTGFEDCMMHLNTWLRLTNGAPPPRGQYDYVVGRLRPTRTPPYFEKETLSGFTVGASLLIDPLRRVVNPEQIDTKVVVTPNLVPVLDHSWVLLGRKVFEKIIYAFRRETSPNPDFPDRDFHYFFRNIPSPTQTPPPVR